MPAPKKQNTVAVTCPKCGHVQQEPRGAYSTVCKECRSHFRLDELESPAPKKPAKPPKPAIELKQVICFQCGTELEAPTAAESTMCKRCSSHVDLRDYSIAQTVSKNFRTHGRLVLEEKGYIMNTDSHVGDAVIKGRFIGKIIAVRTLEIQSTATIKGTFTTGRLLIPAGHHFRWTEPMRIGGAEISGELVADVHCTGTFILKSTSRFFGTIEAKDLVVESGAVFVGEAKIGLRAGKDEPQPQPARPAEQKPKAAPRIRAARPRPEVRDSSG